MKSRYLYLAFIFTYASLEAQVTPEIHEQKNETFSSESWCSDQMTIPFGTHASKRSYLSGIRLEFVPQLGTIIQSGRNKIAVQLLYDLPKFALSTNLYQGWMSIQAGVIYPSSIKFEDESEIVKQGYLNNSENLVGIDYGLSVAFTFLDGILAIGYGRLSLTVTDFKSNYDGSTIRDFWFVNIQSQSLASTLLKNVKNKE